MRTRWHCIPPIYYRSIPRPASSAGSSETCKRVNTCAGRKTLCWRQRPRLTQLDHRYPHGPSVGPNASPHPLLLTVSNTSNLERCHLLRSECQPCRPRSPPGAPLIKSMLVKAATYRRHRIPGATLHRVPPGSVPYQRPLFRSCAPPPSREGTPIHWGKTVKRRLIALCPPLFEFRHSKKARSLKKWWGLRPSAAPSWHE